MREMKNSGIEWIGEIPNEWLVGRVKYIFTRKNEKAMQEDPIILSLTRSGVRVRDMSNNDGQIAESYYNYNPVIPGDFLLNPRDLYSGANCNVSYVYGVISPAYINLRAKGQNSARYFDYFFKNQYWAMAMFAHGKGVSFDNRWTISAETLLNYSIPIPSIDEQKKIADFLDEKCAEINTVIEKTKATIEEYKKLKQSVITQAVTKGIRSNRPMKDSGIEWIGEIPAEWDLRAIKTSFSVYAGATPKSEVPEFWDGDIRWITPADYKTEDKFVEIGRRQITLQGYNSCGTNLVPAGSIVFSKRAPIGSVAICKTELCTNQGCLSCVPIHRLNIDFFYFVLSVLTEIFNLFGSGTTFKEISYDSFVNFRLPYPNVEEQNEIADYLDKKCSEIDELITKKTSLLSELESYKKSLIYEYVTGKKEV